MCFIVSHLSWSNAGHCFYYNIKFRMQFALMEIPPISLTLFNSAIPIKSNPLSPSYVKRNGAGPQAEGSAKTPPSTSGTHDNLSQLHWRLSCVKHLGQPSGRFLALTGYAFEQRHVCTWICWTCPFQAYKPNERKMRITNCLVVSLRMFHWYRLYRSCSWFEGLSLLWPSF